MVNQVLETAKIEENNIVLDNLNVIGNVGIGTTEPNAKLHVQGNISINDNDIRLRGGTDKNHGIGWYGGSKLFAGKGPDGPVVFGNLGGALGTNHEGAQKIALQWNSNGNVGIGTSNPEAGLHVDKGNTNDLALKLSSTGPGWGSGIQLQNKDINYGIYAGFRQLKICDADKGVDRLIIDDAGNVGIGTTEPNAKLHVQGNISINDNEIRLRGGTDKNHGIGWYGGRKLFADKGPDGPVVYGNLGGALGTNHEGAQKIALQWNSNGNVGIGTTNPQRSLHLYNNNGNCLILQNPRGGSGTTVSLDFQTYDINAPLSPTASVRAVDNNWSSDLVFLTKDPGKDQNGLKERLRITNNGNVGIGTGTPKYALDVNGTINASADVVVGGGDCAEEFDIVDAESIEPGTVMVIDNDGALKASEKAYDKRVAGVISGAGDLRPGITLHKQANKANRLPLALNGKVYCKVDADCCAVEVGDLLTTSPTYGHAMKVTEHVKSIGAIIGKALRPLEAGCDLIPILVALQ